MVQFIQCSKVLFSKKLGIVIFGTLAGGASQIISRRYLKRGFKKRTKGKIVLKILARHGVLIGLSVSGSFIVIPYLSTQLVRELLLTSTPQNTIFLNPELGSELILEPENISRFWKLYASVYSTVNDLFPIFYVLCLCHFLTLPSNIQVEILIAIRDTIYPGYIIYPEYCDW